MIDKNITFLINNYKYKNFMDDACSEIVKKLNSDYFPNEKKQEAKFILSTPQYYGKNDFFCGYYIIHKKENYFYIGLNWNFINKNEKDIDLDKFFLSVDIKLKHSIYWNRGKPKNENNTLILKSELDYIKDNKGSDDIWVYLKILPDKLSCKDDFKRYVEPIIKENYKPN